MKHAIESLLGIKKLKNLPIAEVVNGEDFFVVLPKDLGSIHNPYIS